MRIPLLLLLWLTLTGLASAGNGGLTGSESGPIRMNLSVLFQYNETDPLSWRPMLEEASKLLYDATEKQMQLGNITIYVNAPQMKAGADALISDDPTKGASAHIFGLGYRGYHMFYSQIHKQISERARGQLGFVHELGHYAFGMYDEYQGSVTRAASSDLPLLEGVKKFFCTGPQTGGVSSIMDAGTTTLNNVRTEFCFQGNHNFGRFEPAEEEGGQGHIYRNKQQVQRRRSCWDQAVAATRGWKLTLTAPTVAPTSDVSGHLPINITVQQDLVPRTVLLLDNSSPDVKQAAATALEGLNDGTFLSVVALGSPATTAFNLTVLDAESRARAQEVIGNLTRTGAADLDAGLRLALAQFATRSPRGGNENVLIVTASSVTPGATTTTELKSAQVRTSYATVGEAVDLAPLQELARATGGGGQSAVSGEQADQAVEEEARLFQGDQPVDYVSRSLAPGESYRGTVFVDSFLTTLSFEVDPGFELAVLDPQGRASAPDVVSPQVGTWSYSVTNRGSAPAEFDLEVFGSDVTTGVEAGGDDLVAFPRAQRFQVAVFAGDGGVQGASVKGTVYRPDGSEAPLTLYDDGSDGHGDDEAGDGVYSNYYGAFRGSGVYAFDTLARNVSGRTASSDDLDSDVDVLEPVAPFQRLNSFGFEVDGVPAAVGAGALTVRSLGGNRFAFTAGPSEGVLVTSVTAAVSGAGLGVLVVDEDESVRVPLAGGQATFADPVFVEAGQTRTVEIDVDREPSSASAFPLVPWFLAGFAGFVWAARRQPRRAPVWAGVLLLGTLVVSGCGFDSTDFVSSSPVSAPPLTVTARGITSEAPVRVDVQ